MPKTTPTTTTSVEKLQAIIRTAPQGPGVYRMHDKDGNVLYVGKAKQLAKRLQNYTQIDKLTFRIQRMVAQIDEIILTHTGSESEALLLEASLIKSLKPRYNILLRDDKSYPYICINHAHPFPQIMKYRGRSKDKVNEYFGPFASAGDVNATITLLQKLFLLRPCSDNYFAGRKRPCIQYQIKRCSAPCVSKISQEEYQDNLKQAALFLQGKSATIQKMLTSSMDKASDKMEYELAALYRNRLQAITQVQARQHVYSAQIGDADIIAILQENTISIIQIFFFRGGQHYGNRHFFPLHAEHEDTQTILATFIGQFYQTHIPPKQVIVSHLPPDAPIISEALATLAGHKVELLQPKAGEKLQILNMALTNAKEALSRHVRSLTDIQEQLQALTVQFQLPLTPERIEIFDNSHTMGEQAVGAMVVAGVEGFSPRDYRHYFFPAQAASGGDDYAMLRQMLTRRIGKDISQTQLWLIDGGQNHLKIAEDVLKTHNITHITCIAIAKGPERNAGREILYTSYLPPAQLDQQSPLLHFLQRLRDEAHRFAITTHRKRRGKKMTASAVDDIPGIGPIYKKRLLAYFGSLSGVASVSLADLQKVPGIGKKTAAIIHAYLHPQK